MAKVSLANPLPYIIARQIDDKVDYCKRLVNARLRTSENLFRRDLLSHYGCVNAIEFSEQGDLLVSGGDDRRVLLWNVEKAVCGVGKPVVMKTQHNSNIFCLSFDRCKSKIFSAGNDDQVIVHDMKTRQAINCYIHEKPVYGLSLHPHNDNVFSSACDNGKILIYDIRGSSTTETFCLANCKTAFHSVMFSPVEPRLLVTANAKEGISMWDIRKPLEPVMRYGSEGPSQNCMSVKFNAAGDRLLALRRRLPPILYEVKSSDYLCQFDNPGYYNSCTMKSCCFAGDNDEYVLSGSDDFNLYMWKIPETKDKWVELAHIILRGHRSIVNQVRYNHASCILASSGVEKVIKIWSPFTFGKGSLGGLQKDTGKEEKQRRVFTHDEYIGLVIRSGQFMTHDYSHQSTNEDPRMMAFFDSLVQREIEGWSSEDFGVEQRSPSVSENNRNPDEAASAASNSDDSASDNLSDNLNTQLLNSILRARDSSESATTVPDKTTEAPNRIRQLIASRREKLMRLAAMEAGGSARTSPTTATTPPTASTTATTTTTTTASSNNKKKQQQKTASQRTRKKAMKKTLSQRRSKRIREVSESDSDEEVTVDVDSTQPSTSSGLVSRKSRYRLEDDERSTNNSSSSSSSSCTSSDNDDEDNNSYSNKCQKSTDSDNSTIMSRVNKRRKYEKSIVSSKRSKTEQKGEANGAIANSPRASSRKGKRVVGAEGSAGSTVTQQPKKSRFNRSQHNSDSGITSGMSTCEKKKRGGREREAANNDSSDQEEKKERFRRKVDSVRRSHRRVTRVMATPPSSDSSN